MPSTGRQRPDEFVPELIDETSFGVEPTWTGEVLGSITNVDRSSMQEPMIEDPSYTTDGGAHEQIVGNAYTNVSAPMGQKVEGLQVSPANGVTAIETFQIKMAKYAFQAEPNLTDTDVNTGVPTTTSMDMLTPGSQDATGIVNIAYEVSAGVYEARPATVVADTATFLMEPSAAPGTGLVVLGSAQLRYNHKPQGISGSMRLLGNDAYQHRYLQGITTGLTIPEVGPNDVPVMEYTMQAANAEERPTNPDSDVRGTPPTQSGKVFTNADILIGSYGNVDALSACASRVAITNLGGGFLPDECGGQANGINSWGVRPKGPVMFTIKVPHNVVPAAITGKTSLTWRAALNAGGTEVLYHVFWTYGQNVPGFSQSWYFSKALLWAVGPTDVNEQDANELTFVSGTGLSSIESQAAATWW
jgi:hypothetical protein